MNLRGFLLKCELVAFLAEKEWDKGNQANGACLFPGIAKKAFGRGVKKRWVTSKREVYVALLPVQQLVTISLMKGAAISKLCIILIATYNYKNRNHRIQYIQVHNLHVQKTLIVKTNNCAHYTFRAVYKHELINPY